MSPNDTIVIEAWQILVVVVLPLVGFGALLYRTWIKPAAKERIALAKWRDKTDRDIEELRKRFDRHDRGDAGIARKLEEVTKCLVQIRERLARIEERIRGEP